LHLLAGGYVPVVATLGAGPDGTLYNVNADTLAAALAVRLQAARLLVAGTTPGVLDADGRTMAGLALPAERALAAAGTVNRGMLAKLHACRDAIGGGVPDVAIVDGRDAARLRAALAGDAAASGSMTRVL
jgi:acetylglutamate kinase